MPGTHRLLSRCTLYPNFNRFTNFNASSLSIYPSIASIFPVFCHGATRFLHHYPYVTSVCLTRTQMHLPQAQPLHRINVFARFFHGFISVLLLHSGHTSKPQFFHCFSIVSRVLYAILVPHRSLKCSIVVPSYRCPSFHSYFTWHHFRPTSEPQFFHCVSIVLLHFFIIVPRFFHCFSIANGLTSKPHFFPLLFDSFTQHHFPLHSSLPSVFSQFFLQFYSIVP